MKKSDKARKEIKEELYLYVEADVLLTGSLEQVAKNILSLKSRLIADYEHKLTEHQKHYPSNTFVIIDPSSYERIEFQIIAPDEYPEIRLHGIRLETDNEYSKRMQKIKNAQKAGKVSAKIRAEKVAADELAMYERLAKKYGGNVPKSVQ